METIRKTISVTEQQDQWIKAQIERGKFTNDSEYIRDLNRRDQGSAKFQTLKDTIQEGLDSICMVRKPQFRVKMHRR